MKILYLCADLGIPVLGRKGAAAHVRGLATALARAGHTVSLAAASLSKSPWEKPAKFDLPLCQLRPSSDIERVFLSLKSYSEALETENSVPGEVRRILYDRELAIQLRRRFEKDPPDFIYERASLYATAGVLLARKLNVPSIIELNSPLPIEQAAYRGAGLGDLAARAERWILSQSDAVVVVSNELREYAVSLGIDPGRVRVVPNGADPNLFRPRPRQKNARARWGLRDGPVLGFVGGIRPWHGVQVLPPLLERLVPRHKDLRLVIAGDGPLRAELERNLNTKGLAQNVVWTKSLPHDEIAELIPHFDVALAPYSSLNHAFYFSPLKLYEYMACGVPVVAARTGQIAEVVRDGETGLLYPPDDVEALTRACDRLLDDPALRERMGQAAARAIRERYTWDHNAARVVELARSLMQAREVSA